MPCDSLVRTEIHNDKGKENANKQILIGISSKNHLCLSTKLYFNLC